MSDGDLFYQESGVPERHKKFRPAENNGHDQWGAVYSEMKSKIESGSLFAVVGNRGTGKTQLGAAMIGCACLELDRTAKYRKAFDIFLRIREAMKREGDSERSAVAEFARPFLLVIDAFEVRSESQFECRVLDHIIDLRYDAVKPTIIISNDTPEQFSKIVGPSIVDRIKETGGIIKMDWKSFR